jgi:hypothetical protein
MGLRPPPLKEGKVEITKEFLEARMAEFKQEKEKALMMANRFDGAIIATQMMLEALGKPLFEEGDIELLDEEVPDNA